MNENIQENESKDENTNDSTKEGKCDMVSGESQLPSKPSINNLNNKNQIGNENDESQAQFSMEIIQTTPPSNLTPSTVQSHNPNETKEPEKYRFCDGCCSDAPIRTASSRIGPFSTYSVCFFILNIFSPSF